LIKHFDGSFTGIQIKTKASNQPVWKVGDDSVIKAFAKFVMLDNQYPKQFRAFKCGTNHPIQSSKNSQDIFFLLCDIKLNPDFSSLHNGAKIFIEEIPTARILDKKRYLKRQKPFS